CSAPDFPVYENQNRRCYCEDPEHVDVRGPQRVAYPRDHSWSFFQSNASDRDERHSHPGVEGYSVRIIQNRIVQSRYLLLEFWGLFDVEDSTIAVLGDSH